MRVQGAPTLSYAFSVTGMAWLLYALNGPVVRLLMPSEFSRTPGVWGLLWPGDHGIASLAIGFLGGLVGVVQVYRLGTEQPVRRVSAVLVVLTATVVSLVLLPDAGFRLIAGWCASALIVSCLLGDRLRASIRARRWWIRPLQAVGFGVGPLAWFGTLIGGSLLLGTLHPVAVAVGFVTAAITVGPAYPVLAVYSGVVGLVVGVIQAALKRSRAIFHPEVHK